MSTKSKTGLIDTVEGLLHGSKKPYGEGPKKILIVSPEVTPYANVGGVSRVMAHLSQSLYNLGYDVRLFMPKFGFIDEKSDFELKMVYEGLRVPTDNPEKPYILSNVKMHQQLNSPTVYFLENREYYELRANVYGYKDDAIRWVLLARGAIEFVRTWEEWVPDIIHANDWQLGSLPDYLRRRYVDDPVVGEIPCVFTIHNLSYQGMFNHRDVSDYDSDDGKSLMANFFDERLLKLNFMRRGIMYADAVNTVSPTYSREILKPDHGEGLDRLLTENRSKLSGILNGIDYKEYNPATDRLTKAKFDMYSLGKRVQNKLALQLEFDLEINEDIPIFGFVGRLEGYQKGLDLVLEIVPTLLKEFNVQFVFIGGGDMGIASRIRELTDKFPKKVGGHLMLDFDLPRLLFAGADVVMVPSRFEPCGLTQMEGMRYGAVPLVHKTGGLADSVQAYDSDTDKGFGFVFENYSSWSLFAQVVRAIETFRRKDVWAKIQKRAMSQDNSWENRAQLYVDFYEKGSQLYLQNHNRKAGITPDSELFS
ncbi:glycogen synthase [bacterium]|uniref:Glycogen synthase n=2 Tax=Katanobacteria TaxID=422282 RepID=A0A2M7X418_UNCKA|nr:glycogen synthase [bacterium]PIP57000.1 MAG: hypothetical protein COX05_00125 [candidate division WWE3 bacterium CG22_combo_CG10-13_8_21_14_all_39_12]PJA40888.1 MAG: hypothetical protein CO179_01150 [candidate division WWE3 bacterium CG_4_9_14_3_um_filter_39_7]